MKKTIKLLFAALLLCLLPISVTDDNVPQRAAFESANARNLPLEEIATNMLSVEYISTSYAISDAGVLDGCTGVVIEKAPYKTDYLAFEQIDLEGAIIYAAFSDGRYERLKSADISVEYQNGKHLLVSDEYVILSFSGYSASLPISVRAAEYDLAQLRFDDLTVIYDGREHTIVPDGDVLGMDGIPLYYSVSGGGKNVGEYRITLSFRSESENYVTPAPLTRKLTVAPLALDVVYEDTVFVYDGGIKTPRARIATLEESVIYLDVSGGAQCAGEYTATAYFGNKNYSLRNAQTKFEILKSDIDLSGVVWSSNSFDYNGKIQNVTVSGLPDSVILSGYENAAFSDAGEYVATAILVFDERNYNPPAPLTHNWRIEAIEYDISSFYFEDKTYIYDGEIHYPEPKGDIKRGLDGSVPSYSFSDGATHVFDGTVEVKISFFTESVNYKAPSDMRAYVTVIPKRISVGWDMLSFVYDGEAHSPIAFSDECAITVTESFVNAGKYTVSAYPETGDYEIINSTAVMTISKALNYWISLPEIGDFYESGSPDPISAPRFGKAEYEYFTDPLMQKPAERLTFGTYYMRAIVPEGDNYLALESEGVRFTVLEVLPVSLHADLLADRLFSLEKINDTDISVFLLNNDGSKTVLGMGEFSVIYESGDSLRMSDSEITVAFGDFKLVMPVEVGKARYDMSGVFWNERSHVYDGSVRIPYLCGLPEGVSVKEYGFAGASAAGEYELFAVFDYDSENYEEPSVEPVSFIIEKRPITVKIGSRGDSYTVELGSIVDGDTLSEEYYSENGLIYLSSLNENYDITVLPAKERGNSAYLWLILVFVLVMFTLALVAYSIIRSPDKVLKLASLVKRLALGKNSTKRVSPVSPCDASSLPLDTLLAVDSAYADNLISNSLAKSLISDFYGEIITSGKKKYSVSTSVLSEHFDNNSVVDINAMKRRGVIPKDAKYVKITADGVIDKPLTVIADSFSLSAVKMIALTGGEVRKVKKCKKKK